jgi:mannosyltransferase
MPMRFAHPMRAFAIAIFGFLVTLWNLGTPSLWQDEAATIAASNRPISSLLKMLTNIDAVHGLYYGIMHFWGGAFGFSPFGVRFPSALAVAFSAYLLYFLALKLTSKSSVAMWAALVFIALPRTQLSGVEARSNALTATVAIALTLAFIWVLENPKSWRRWIAYLMLAVLSIYLFIFSGLIFIALAAYLVIQNRGALRSFILATALAFVLAAPVLIYGFKEKAQVGWITAKPIYQYLWEAVIAVDYGRAWPMAILGLLLASFAVFKRASVLVLCWAILPSLVLVLVSVIWQPYFVDHYLTFTTPATAVLVAIGISEIRWPKPSPRRGAALQLLVGALLLALSVPSFVASRDPAAKGTEWASIAQVINANSKPGDSILLPDATSKSSRVLDQIIVAYAPDFVGRIDLTLVERPEATRRLFGKRILERNAPEPGSGRVVLVEDLTASSQRPSWLGRDFTAGRVINFATAIVRLFDRKK